MCKTREPSHGLDHQRFTFQNDPPPPVPCCLWPCQQVGTSCRDGSDDECSEKVALTDYGCCPSTMPAEHGLLWVCGQAAAQGGHPPSSELTAPREEPPEHGLPSSFPHV